MIHEIHDADIRHLWHPYTDISSYEKKPPLCIESADGIYLYDSYGRAIIDGTASWWTLALGHNNTAVIEAIQAQAEQLQHVMLGGMTHPRAVELAQRLAELAPGDLNHVYFASDGSSVVDAALKMTVQYWQLRGKPEKHRFISLENAYHGDSIGAMSVGYISWFQGPYGSLLHPPVLAPSPHARTADPAQIGAHAQAALAGMRALLEQQHTETAAVIIEPLCQGAAGMRLHPPTYLAGVRALCDEFGVLLIADEIATGFHRTGALFACNLAGVKPDILCLGKALSGGYLPLSAAIVADPVYEAFRAPAGEKRVFWDGHTFCGNPIACAAALAALSEYDRLGYPETLREKENLLAVAFAAMNSAPGVEYARSLGMIAMCAFRQDAGGAELAAAAATRALELELLVRPLGEVIYLWPPLTITQEEIQTLLARFAAAIEQALEKMTG